MWYVIKDCSLPCSHLSEAEIPLQTDVAKKISLPVYWAPTQLSSWEEQGISLSHQFASYLLLRLSWASVTQRWNLSSSQSSLMDWRCYHGYSMLRILWPQFWLFQILRWWSYAKKGKGLTLYQVLNNSSRGCHSEKSLTVSLPLTPESWLRYFTCREKQALKQPCISTKWNGFNFQ